MNHEFIYIILIIALGYIFKRLKILQEKDGVVISKIIFKITMPALIIVTFNSVKIETSLMMLPVFVVTYGAFITLLGFYIFKNEERELKGSFLMLSTGFNVALFAFPLVQVIWGKNGLTHFSMFDAGASLTTFGIAYILGSYFSEQGLRITPVALLKKLGKSIPLMTYIIACGLNLCHMQLPDFIIHIAGTLSQANMPLSLLLLGLYLSFTFEKRLLKPIMKYLVFRYSFALVVGVTLFFILPFEEMLRYTLLIGFLLPAAASTLAFAVEFKYSIQTTRLVATISNITILIGIFVLFVFSHMI